MPSARFTSICNNLSKFGDYIAFVCLKDSVAFAVSNDNGTGKLLCTFISNNYWLKKQLCLVAIKIPQTDVSRDQVEESVSIEVVQPLTIQFPSYYLNLFCKAAPLSSEVLYQKPKNTIRCTIILFYFFSGYFIIVQWLPVMCRIPIWRVGLHSILFISQSWKWRLVLQILKTFNYFVYQPC